MSAFPYFTTFFWELCNSFLPADWTIENFSERCGGNFWATWKQQRQNGLMCKRLNKKDQPTLFKAMRDDNEDDLQFGKSILVSWPLPNLIKELFSNFREGWTLERFGIGNETLSFSHCPFYVIMCILYNNSPVFQLVHTVWLFSDPFINVLVNYAFMFPCFLFMARPVQNKSCVIRLCLPPPETAPTSPPTTPPS